MISCNTQHLQAVVQYLSVLEEQQLEIEELNGKETYCFQVPSVLITQSVKKARRANMVG